MSRPPSDEEFTELVHACWHGLYRTAYLMLGDRAEAEDLVQTALAKTYAQWRKVRSLEAAPGYARTTMVNTAASWFRKKGWRNEHPTETLPERADHRETDLSVRPTVLDALATLPPRQRAVQLPAPVSPHHLQQTNAGGAPSRSRRRTRGGAWRRESRRAGCTSRARGTRGCARA